MHKLSVLTDKELIELHKVLKRRLKFWTHGICLNYLSNLDGLNLQYVGYLFMIECCKELGICSDNTSFPIAHPKDFNTKNSAVKSANAKSIFKETKYMWNILTKYGRARLKVRKLMRKKVINELNRRAL